MEASDQICSSRRRPLGRTPTGLGVLVLLLCVAIGLFSTNLSAQRTVTGRGKNFVAPVTDAQGHKTVLRGQDFKPGRPGTVEIDGMQAETFKGQEKDMIVQAPQCVFEPKSNVANSAGTLTIRTADQRFSIEGRGFRWELGDSRLTSKLSISNEVHSLVRKRLLDTKTGPPQVAGGGATPGATPASAAGPKSVSRPNGAGGPSVLGGPGGTNQFIEVTSEQFEYAGDVAIYRGHVHVKDEQGNLSCGLLTIRFTGDNAALDRIEGEQDVVLEQGLTRTIADKAVYIVQPDKEIVQFLGHAIWQDGERQGSGERVDYDRRKRLLVAEGNAYLRLPRSALGDANLLSGSPRAQPPLATNAAASYVEVFSDKMTVQMSTNGPVQSMVAEKNVLIVDPTQDGRALADQATYREATGLLELTGSPILETQQRLVNGKMLVFDRTNRVFRATPDAYVKLPFHALASLGLLPNVPEKPKHGAPAAATNQFVEVWAKTFEYRTNLLRFVGNVRASFLQSDVALGQLTCGNLTFYYGEKQLESMAAEDNVQAEQFPIPGSPKPVRRKLSCPKLRAEFGPAGKLDSAWAEQGVVVEQEEKGRKDPNPVFTTATADSVTAYFSKTTNRVERVVAEKDVLVKQGERRVHGAKAVYTEATELLELTGQPTASMPEGDITEAERLIWDRAHARFLGRGKFKSTWKRAAAGTNQFTSPLSRAK